ncbi:MAG TPA: spore coat protein [Candidatus Avamphibacillus intestinigallinarum]|nr:spore coat protein [Candidatus Avamphibacillus intestinigallinarum]
MSCGEKHRHDGSNCVCGVLKEIVLAQTDVIDNCCDVSCEKSISDLLGNSEPGNDLDTVPILLYCKGKCNPFKGYGAFERHHGGVGEVVASYYFRVKKVTKDCCAVLELLRDPSDRPRGDGDHHKHHNNDPKNPIDQRSRHLKATGICITVDLDCFCHVTCLPAIEALC